MTPGYATWNDWSVNLAAAPRPETINPK